jgi:hypothetical protein
MELAMNRMTFFQPKTAFVEVPADLITTAFPIDRQQTEDLYRKAYEQAREMVRPTIVDRLAPFWN